MVPATARGRARLPAAEVRSSAACGCGLPAAPVPVRGRTPAWPRNRASGGTAAATATAPRRSTCRCPVWQAPCGAASADWRRGSNGRLRGACGRRRCASCRCRSGERGRGRFGERFRPVRCPRQPPRRVAPAPACSRPCSPAPGATRWRTAAARRCQGETTCIRSGKRPWISRKQIAVEAQLQDGAGFRLPRELGVHHFVGPVAKPARLVDPSQHVRPPHPAPFAQRRLHDDGHAAAHRPLRLRLRAGLETRHALGKRFDVGRFVRVAAFAQQLHFLLLPLKARWARNPPVDPIQVQPRQMATGEEVGQVGGGQPKAVVGELHGRRARQAKQASYTAVRPSAFRQRESESEDAIQRRGSGKHRVMVASRCPETEYQWTRPTSSRSICAPSRPT